MAASSAAGRANVGYDYDRGRGDEDVPPRDPAIDATARRVRALFEASPEKLFYSTQIQTTLEREFFHWITGKALLELGNSRTLQRVQEVVRGNAVTFYAHRRHRYWRRELRTMTALLERIFDPEFSHAVGRHGELVFDAALGRAGFRAEARDTSSWNSASWTTTNHKLDRVITRDGRAYGVEIKNTQNYIPRMELRLKTQLCRHLRLIPLFIMRFAPKSYIHEVNQSGGFVLLFEHQMYPWGHNALVAAVRETLGLKVHSPANVKEGDIQRLLAWHGRQGGHE